MSKRFTDTEKYKKPFIRNLPAAYKIFWDYLYHDCSFSGIWQVDFEVAQIRVGKDAPINREEALRLFNEGEERIVVLNCGSKWLIKPFIDFQYGVLNPENKAHNSVLNELKKNGIKGLASPVQGAKDKDKDKDKDTLIAIKNNPAYQGIDIDTELAKMDAWLLAHPGRKKTMRFVIRWLNKIEKPLPPTQVNKPKGEDLMAKYKKYMEEADDRPAPLRP